MKAGHLRAEHHQTDNHGGRQHGQQHADKCEKLVSEGVHACAPASKRSLYARLQRQGLGESHDVARRLADPRSKDSVAPDQKIAAREQVAEAARTGGFGGREVVIRVNGPHTPWGEEDLAAASAAGPDAVLLPKVDGPGAIMLAARTLREAGAPDRTRIWAMMETPNAILNAGSIAAVAADPSSRLSVMVMGLNDLAKETRARLTPGARP